MVGSDGGFGPDVVLKILILSLQSLDGSFFLSMIPEVTVRNNSKQKLT